MNYTKKEDALKKIKIQLLDEDYKSSLKKYLELKKEIKHEVEIISKGFYPEIKKDEILISEEFENYQNSKNIYHLVDHEEITEYEIYKYQDFGIILKKIIKEKQNKLSLDEKIIFISSTDSSLLAEDLSKTISNSISNETSIFLDFFSHSYEDGFDLNDVIFSAADEKTMARLIENNKRQIILPGFKLAEDYRETSTDEIINCIRKIAKSKKAKYIFIRLRNPFEAKNKELIKNGFLHIIVKTQKENSLILEGFRELGGDLIKKIEIEKIKKETYYDMASKIKKTELISKIKNILKERNYV